MGIYSLFKRNVHTFRRNVCEPGLRGSPLQQLAVNINKQLRGFMMDTETILSGFEISFHLADPVQLIIVLYAKPYIEHLQYI